MTKRETQFHMLRKACGNCKWRREATGWQKGKDIYCRIQDRWNSKTDHCEEYNRDI